MLSLVFYRVIKAAIDAEKKFHNAGYEFFLQCWLLLSPYKTPKKAFYHLNTHA
jgi:hypothetical protein